MSQPIALLSVYDKTGLLKLAEGLSAEGVELIGSGGTAKKIREANIKIEKVLPFAHAPEMLGGRVKTLHPAVHGGILARSIPSDERDLEQQSISKISIVVCNLYPFTSTISKPGCTLAEAVEEIDIGGVTLLRAAAKNHERVSVLSDPADYDEFLDAWKSGGVSQALRNRLALKAFEMTAKYDEAISGYFREQYATSAESHPVQRMVLRYGANPHQKPAQAFVTESELPFKVLCGSPGYINLLVSAWSENCKLRVDLGIVSDTSRASGVYPGEITPSETSLEIIFAVARSQGAERAMKSPKDDIRSAPVSTRAYAQARGVRGSLRSSTPYTCFSVSSNATPTAAPAGETASDLLVATLALKYTQSNSVAYAKNGAIVGLGAGQQSRIHCTRLAGGKADLWWLRHHPRVLALPFKKGVKRAEKANAIDLFVSGEILEGGEKEQWEGQFETVPAPLAEEERKEWAAKLDGVACSSDAFFPFADNVHRARKSGVRYLAAPSGSVMDAECIKAADEHKMVFCHTSLRLFHH
ncbi:hypothetical protein PAXINDRAFT_160155 [Paxillus involutus ATCC 200175]|nr:hypothetical protein PAXINDRAFT_160155 [Paxillus involutus ATCC 200175]